MVSDNLAAAIARATILEKELARNPIWPVGVETSNDSSQPRDVEFLGTMFDVAEPMPAPDRLYVSMGANGVRMFTADPTREHDAPVTEYVTRAALDEVLDALEGMDDDEPCRIDHNGNCQAHGINQPCDNAIARGILAKHGRSS